MAHKSRRQRQQFDCKHVAFGKYCHRCKDEAAGKIKPKKMVVNESGEKVAVSVAEAPKKYWQKAKCPYCGGSRVKKNEINAFSANDTKEYRCTSFECGKQFNSEQVKEYEQVEVKDTPRTPYNPRLTD